MNGEKEDSGDWKRGNLAISGGRSRVFVAARALGALKGKGLGSECSGGNVDFGVVDTGR